MSNLTHTPVGDITIAVGIYEKGGETKRNARRIGTLMQTDEPGRDPRYWIKLNADAVNPSLLMLQSLNGLREKGSDSIILNCWPPPREKKPVGTTEAEQPEAPPDDIPF